MRGHRVGERDLKPTLLKPLGRLFFLFLFLMPSVWGNIIPSRMSFQTLGICFKGKSAWMTGGNFNHIPIHSRGVSGN